MRFSALAVLSFACLVLPVAAAPLRSPWDVAPVAVTQGAYGCAALPPLPREIVSFDYYSDPQHSKIDAKRKAAYDASVGPIHDLMNAAITAADTFRTTGNSAAANCVFTLLSTQARAAAMTGSMASNQSYYVQGWTVGALAVTWLKVRTAQPGTPADRTVVTEWLANVARSTETYFQARHEKHTNDGQNNHLYWAGFAVMSAGIAADDRKMFDWGVGTYASGAGEIAADGTLPLEMARGQKALHYHLFAIAPLVTMAEFGAANGMNLYGMDGRALSRLIDRTMSGLRDNTWFAEKAKAPQDTPEGKVKSDDVLPLTPYVRRFPSPAISTMIASVTPRGYLYLGGLPPP